MKKAARVLALVGVVASSGALLCGNVPVAALLTLGAIALVALVR